MKAKKLILLAVASLTLSGCSIDDLMFWKKKEDEPAKKDDDKPTPGPERYYDINPEITGGTEEDATAILEALNYTGVCYYGSNEFDPAVEMPVSFEDGKNIDLFKQVKYDDGHICKLTWTVDASQDYCKGVLNSDATHDYIEIDYKYRTSDSDPLIPDGKLSWKLSKITCNDAVAEPDLEFKAAITNSPYYYQEQSIDEIYSITDSPKTVAYKTKSGEDKSAKYASTFDICNYEFSGEKDDKDQYLAYVPGYIPNNPSATENEVFRYEAVVAKHIYSAPDGNFGLVRNGKNVLEIYAGSGEGTPLTLEKFPHFAEEYVKLYGTMGQYRGNVQLSFINQITGVTAEEKATVVDVPEEEAYEVLDAERIASLKVDGFSCQKQAVIMDGHCFSNSLRYVTGDYIANSLKDSSDTVVAPSAMKNGKGAHYSFKIKVGSEELTVTYNYHTDQKNEIGLFNTIKSKLEAGGKGLKIKGMMNYSGYDSEGAKNNEPDTNWLRTEGNPGVWTIVPFLADHVA